MDRRSIARRLVVAASLLATLLSGCEGECLECVPPLPPVQLSEPAWGEDVVVVPPDHELLIIVTGTSGANATVTVVELVSDPPGAFTLESSPTPTAAEPVFLHVDARLEVRIARARSHPAAARATGTLNVFTGSRHKASATADLMLEAPTPHLRVTTGQATPQCVDLGETRLEGIALNSSGGAPLTITGARIESDPGFVLEVGAQVIDVRSGEVTFDRPLVIASGATAVLPLRFTPPTLERAHAALWFHSNDPRVADPVDTHADERIASIDANTTCSPRVDPHELHFGAVPVGATRRLTVTLSPYESFARLDALEIRDADWGPIDKSPFAIDPAVLATLPRVLREPLVVEVSFTPDRSGPFAAFFGVFEPGHGSGYELTGEGNAAPR